MFFKEQSSYQPLISEFNDKHDDDDGNDDGTVKQIVYKNIPHKVAAAAAVVVVHDGIFVLVVELIAKKRKM